MLQSLHIENYALIARLSLEFGPGLNLLTGETGSGKSIVVDALGLLLGGKGSPDLIRGGADRALITGSFSLRRNRALTELAEEMGFELAGEETLVKRELQSSGKTRAFLNDSPVTVAALRGLAPWLSEIHGQNEQTELFAPSLQLAMLDRFAEADTTAVFQGYAAWKAAKERLASLTQGAQEKLRLADLWSFQKREIETVKPQANEDERLESEKQLLANATRLHTALDSAYQHLYEAGGAAAPSTAAALKALEEVARFDASFEKICAELRTARVTLEEAAFAARDRRESLNANPQRLEQIEDRLAELDRLKRKYGPTLADVATHLENVTRQLGELENSDQLAKEAAQQLDQASARYREDAAQLSEARKDAAHRLEKVTQKLLAELAMDGTRFRVKFEVTEEWRPTGTDRVEYFISANPGEPLHPLKDTASGGELSRLMLALKLAAGRGGTGETLVFDEVDAGIGGRVAEAVGRKLKALADSHQVFCVTHLPQIAAFADRHYLVEKNESAGRTITTVRLLSERERTAELARMLSGSRITEASLKHASDLIKTGKT